MLYLNLESRIERTGGWASRQADRQTETEGGTKILHNLKGAISIAVLNFAQLRECERMFSILFLYSYFNRYWVGAVGANLARGAR